MISSETRNKRLPSPNQLYMQGPSAINNANPALLELVASDGGRQVLNYSFQTGEEFSLEFMRDKAFSRKHSVLNRDGAQRTGTNHGVDQRRKHGLPPLPSERVPTSAGNAVGTIRRPNKVSAEPEKKDRNVLPRIISYVPSDSGSVQGSSHGYSSSGSAEGLKATMKFLCSFGGKILPRPSDGKLRYAGGDTRILRVSEHMSWQELKQKTTAIFKQPHLIKYQLPGEDLDALISVSSDEDLSHMIEECSVIDGNQGSQKPRIFLLSSDCNNDVHLSINSLDGNLETQYVVAINGMEGFWDVSSDHGVPSTSGSDLDQLIICNGELDGTKANATVFGSVERPQSRSSKAPLRSLCSQTPANFFSDTRPVSRDNIRHNVDIHHATFHNKDKGIVVPSLTTSDGECSDVSHNADESSCNDISTKNQNADANYIKIQTHALGMKTTETNEIQPKYDFFVQVQLDDATVAKSNLQVPHGSFVPKNASNQWLTNMENQKVSQPLGGDVSASTSNLLKGYDHLSTSAEGSGSPTFISDGETRVKSETSYFRPRDFDVTRAPRKELLIQLSDSDEPNGLQQVLDQKSGVKQELTIKSDGTLYKGNKSSGHQNLCVAEEPHQSIQSFNKNDVPGIEKYDALADSAVQQKRQEFGGQVSQSLPEQAQHDPQETVLSHAEDKEIDTTRNRKKHGLQLGNVEGDKHYKKIELVHEIKPIDEKIWKALDGRRFTNSLIFEDEAHIPDVPHDGRISGTNYIGLNFPTSNTGILMDIDNFTPNNSTCKEAILGGNSSSGTNNGRIQRCYVEARYSSSHVPCKDDIFVGLDLRNHEKLEFDKFHSAPPEETAEFLQDNAVPCFNEVEEPFTIVEESIRKTLLDYEQHKPDNKKVHVPVGDASEAGIGMINVQIIRNEDLEELRELGSGTFGTVYHGRWKGTDVAIKRIKNSCFASPSSQRDKLTKDFWHEAGILSRLNHPNVVAFYGIVKDELGGTFTTVTEYMVNGSLKRVLMRKDKNLDYHRRLLIARDAAIGMEYLHSKNIVHFDLKCDNLLVNLKDQSRPICKIGDFGLSRIKRNTLVSGGIRGTLPWMAPELLNVSSSKVSEKVDVYSFGIVMWEILTGKEPYEEMHYGAVLGGILSNTLRPSVPAICNPEWRRLMEHCWAPHPEHRPSFIQIASYLNAMCETNQTGTSALL